MDMECATADSDEPQSEPIDSVPLLDTEQNSVTNVPSRNWQIGRSLNDCMLNVYTSDRWTDMVIRCGNSQVSRPLKAHKIILATRSPEFEAMLFGPCSDTKTEFDFPAANVDTFDKMLRYMYTDDPALDHVTEARDLMQMAHMYQVLSLVDHCALFLQNNISSSNVCQSLDCALKYDTTKLRDTCCHFIDRNVDEILQTDGFINISKEGLTYILKGDTFYTDEDIIFERVEKWATLKLSELEKDENGPNIRDALGAAFYYLRLPTLPPEKLIGCIKKKGYFSLDEYEDLMECSAGLSRKLCFMSNKKRFPAEHTLSISSFADHKPTAHAFPGSTQLFRADPNSMSLAQTSVKSLCAETIKQTLIIEVNRSFYMKHIEIPVIKTCFKLNVPSKRPDQTTELPNTLNPNLLVVVAIDKIKFENRSVIHQDSGKPSKIVFKEPVLLKACEIPFDLQIRIEPTRRDCHVILDSTYGIKAIGADNCSFRENGESKVSDVESGCTWEESDEEEQVIASFQGILLSCRLP